MSISVDIPVVDGIEVDVSYNLSTGQASFEVSEGIAGCDVFVEAANVRDVNGNLQGEALLLMRQPAVSTPQWHQAYHYPHHPPPPRNFGGRRVRLEIQEGKTKTVF